MGGISSRDVGDMAELLIPVWTHSFPSLLFFHSLNTPHYNLNPTNLFINTFDIFQLLPSFNVLPFVLFWFWFTSNILLHDHTWNYEPQFSKPPLHFLRGFTISNPLRILLSPPPSTSSLQIHFDLHSSLFFPKVSLYFLTLTSSCFGSFLHYVIYIVVIIRVEIRKGK